jgi:hypothetical protein
VEVILLLIPILIVLLLVLPKLFRSEDRVNRLLNDQAASIGCQVIDYYERVEVKSVFRNGDPREFDVWLSDDQGFQHHAVVVIARFLFNVRLVGFQWVIREYEFSQSRVLTRAYDENFDRQ